MSIPAKKTRIRPKLVDDKPTQLARDDDPAPSEEPEQRELFPAKKTLSLEGPFANRSQLFDLLTSTKDGKLIFQGRKDGAIVTTDLEGFKHPRKAEAKPFVFNSTPEDLRRHNVRPKFILGEVIYTIRPMSRFRKVFAARVEGFDKSGTILSVLGATGETKFGKKRTREDGTIIQPTVHCFKETRDLQTYLDAFRDDFTRAQTDFRQLLELKRS